MSPLAFDVGQRRARSRAPSPEPNSGLPEFGALGWPKSETSDFGGGEVKRSTWRVLPQRGIA